MNAAENVIGGLLLDSSAYWKIAGLVVEQDFPRPLRPLFAYIRDTVSAGQDCDAITAGEAGFDDAVSLASATFSLVYLETYAKLVAEDGERQRVREAGQRIALAGSYAEAQNLLAEVRPQQSTRLKTATDGLREMMDAMQARFAGDSVVTGCPTGLETLDQITGGWQAGDLVGVGGETSSGKTAFALQASIHAGRCYYASLEMMAAQLFERVVSNVGHIPYRWIRFPREAPGAFLADESDEYPLTLREASIISKKLPLIVDDQPGLSVDQIAARARQLHMVEPLRLIVVDHLNLVRRPRKNDAAELGEIAIALKNLAKDLKVPVMVLVQLNRAGKQRADRRPQLEDFRSSGEIEEALDTAVMVYRDEYANPNGPLKGYAEFIVRKQRQGERNVTAWAKSYLSQMRFESCEEPDRPAANAAANDGRGGFASRFPTRSQPAPFPRASGDD
ncbi:MAG TPA: DnaB-like helicase C-terminal domain-containing protein [Lysobacter sp.]